jgi:molybdate transport system substrate-binding protein
MAVMQPGSGRRGSLGRYQLLTLGSVLVLVVLGVLLFWDSLRGWFVATPSRRPLVVYVAAVMNPTVEAVGKDYEAAYGVPIHIQSAGSQTLLTQIEVARTGDLYIPADSDYLDLAASRGLVNEILPAATMTAVVAVKEGNPKHIHTMDDLLKKDIAVAQPSPDAAAVGKVTRFVLSRSGFWQRLDQKKLVSKATVTDAANAVQIGSADAAIVWDVTVKQTPGLEAVTLPELADAHGAVGVGVLTCSEQPTAALRFGRYLTARDRGLPYLTRAGFSFVAGDAWAETPEIHLQAPANLQPTIDQAVQHFQQREGVRVLAAYDLPETEALRVGPDPDHAQLSERLRQALARVVKDPQR